jgi:uncharacterized damage-inducible protein DinB
MNAMVPFDPKSDLQVYLQRAREGLLGKLEGLSSYDARRPMTPTATSILGLVKHVAWVQAGYFGAVFNRPFPEQFPWLGVEADSDSDMWARPDEPVEDVVALFRRSGAHADATIESLALEGVGLVPWWPADRNEVTLHRVMVHVIAEMHRHAGHADILRELIDGTTGLTGPGNNMPERTTAEWEAYRRKVEAAAREAST